ncbi:Outer membrane efflux protein [Rubripirellula lacrimiformis]|uniref:Outer membrane efflux protein n=1 Tax=Rubripirellula lacrimiformis TaxID=1930273 RepID=A0A517NBC5_9BACT|nr:TolC family protein [Rubripirellula lacrimiformis]QDT04439.1 Outer membrane efflux protein [Rubripirellula lacrimiformis]
MTNLLKLWDASVGAKHVPGTLPGAVLSAEAEPAAHDPVVGATKVHSSPLNAPQIDAPASSNITEATDAQTVEPFPADLVATPETDSLPPLSSLDQAAQLKTQWWTPLVSDPLRDPNTALAIDLDQLFVLTVMYSGRVLAVEQTKWINQARTAQAVSEFDPTVFGSSRYDSTSDPAESTLTTGGPARLEDDIVAGDAGVRGQNSRGVKYNVGQSLGHKNSNSNFFIPNNQGYTRLFANMTHPLLRGRKIDVNRSLVLTAQFQTKGAQASYHESIQQQLIQVSDAYWQLYTERATFLQRSRHLQRATEIANLLHARADHDSSRTQVLRTRAAVADRTADISQSDARIRNLESNLRSLVNAPELTSNRDSEFLPVQPAVVLPVHFDAQIEVAAALGQRPELQRLNSEMDVARTRLRLANDQKKATLNFVSEAYLAGRQGDSDVLGALTDQFTVGRPGYGAGLVYERPMGNRNANASARQAYFQISQLQHLTTETTEKIYTEVESAVRDVAASSKAIDLRRIAREAAAAEADYLLDRWRSLGNDPNLGQIQLNDLLQAQDRLLQEEQNLLQALVQYNRAVLEVQRATGALVSFASLK